MKYTFRFLFYICYWYCFCLDIYRKIAIAHIHRTRFDGCFGRKANRLQGNHNTIIAGVRNAATQILTRFQYHNLDKSVQSLK